ncbi:N-acetyltransferase [Candidatus Bathyarchaeota archaeon]|nr:N-acetyltransferase [Candidatus Bathyarchaeota archaeon]
MIQSQVDSSAYLDKEVKLGEKCRIEASSKLFSSVELSNNVWISFNTIIFGPVEIGEGSYIGPNCIIGYPKRARLKAEVKKESFEKDLKETLTVIGRNCMIRSGCIIYSNVKIGDEVEFGHNVLVREHVKIGNKSLIGTNSVIDGYSQIGRGVSIQTNAYICAYSKIEDYVFLGPCSVLLNDKYAAQKKAKLIGPVIKKAASIGGNATIMPGVVIGEGALIGALSIVTKNIPPKSIYAGVPAKRLRSIPSDWKSTLKSRFSI